MGSHAESADSEPEWQTGLHKLRLALSTPPQIYDLRALVDSFFRASQDEVEVCIQTFLDINDMSDPHVSPELVKRWRILFKELYQAARKELPKARSSLADKDLGLDTIIATLKSIEKSSVPALTSFNRFLEAPTPGRLNVAIEKLGALSSAIGGWRSRMPGDNSQRPP
jgi:hypothetical protein